VYKGDHENRTITALWKRLMLFIIKINVRSRAKYARCKGAVAVCPR
jgi:hypothetical protein